MTSKRHILVSKVINIINKNLFLFNYKVLVLKGVNFSFYLNKTINALRNSYIRILILLYYISIITELPSLNYSHYSVNPS